MNAAGICVVSKWYVCVYLSIVYMLKGHFGGRGGSLLILASGLYSLITDFL